MPQEKKFVEVGRVVHITTGPCAGEIGAIVDIIDANRLLVDGPSIPRREIKLKNAFLTRIVLKVKKALSHKQLLQTWNNNVVDHRFKRSAYAMKIDKMARRKAITDFEYFKVRRATRTINRIVESNYQNLREKHPGALRKMENKRRIDMGVKLGYRKLKSLTPEQKAIKKARETILSANRKVRMNEAHKAKKEARKAKLEASKARSQAKKDSGTPKPREFVEKEKRKHNEHKNKEKTIPYVSRVVKFRREREQQRLADKNLRRKLTQETQANRAAIKAAKEAGTTPPAKIKAVKVPVKKSTITKRAKKVALAKRSQKA